MVTITGYKERQTQDGEQFFVLEVQGGIEMVRSKQTGCFYATAKKATLPSTFDEDTCIALVGSQMDGKIVKENCEPFTYIVRETGEEITLHHRWVYQQEEVDPLEELIDLGEFSKNGVAELI